MTWYCQDCRKEQVDSKDNVCVDCRNKTETKDKKWFKTGLALLIGSTIIYTAIIFIIIGIGGVF